MSEQLNALIRPVVEGLGFKLWGVEYFHHGQNGTLKVYIDADEGIDVDDCASVSRQLSALLDVEDPIDGHYTLEVSSPGMDRRLFELAQYKAFEGSNVKLTLKVPFEGRKRFKGLLCGTEGDDVIVRDGEEEFLFPFDSIDKANLVPTF